MAACTQHSWQPPAPDIRKGKSFLTGKNHTPTKFDKMTPQTLTFLPPSLHCKYLTAIFGT